MSKNISEIPVTEINERAKSLSRSGRNTDSKIRGVVQDVYLREIPAKFDWNFLLVSSGLTTESEYKTGTVSINTGATSAVFSSDTVITAGMVGRKFNVSGDGVVYEITSMSSTTSCTITPPYQSTQNASNQSYNIFQPNYSLAGDFERFPKPGGIYRWTGGQKKVLEEVQYRPYLDEYRNSPVSIPEKCRLIGQDTAGNAVVELIPPPSNTENLGYDYYHQLRPLIETTAGTVSNIAAGGTTVAGSNTKFTEATTGDWFRLDALGTGADSLWYRIIAITHDSSLILATPFANTAITAGANYTISRAPEMPVRMHIAVLYGALRALELDQTDENFVFYHTQYAQVMSDSKRIYVSRPYNQEITGIHEDYLYRR